MATRDRYTTVAICLHWLIAAFILVNLALGMLHDHVPRPISREMMWWHKSLGVSVLLLTLARIAWRIGHRPPALPAAMAAWEVAVSRITHWALYALMLGLTLTGWIFQSSSPRNTPIPFFGLRWPFIPWVHGMEPAAAKAFTHDWSEWHERLAWVMIALIVLHVAAALKHWLINKDNVMRHMLPFPPKRAEADDPGKVAL